MKKYFLVVLLFTALLYSGGAFAQDTKIITTPPPMNSQNQNPNQSQPRTSNSDDKYRLKDHLFWGGSFLLEFGEGSALGASPIIGYRLTDRLSAGIGGNYIYLTGYDYTGQRFQTSVYGGDVFGRYRLFDKVFAYAEYGSTSYVTPAIDLSSGVVYNYRINVPDFLVGGGYSQQIGRHSFFEILVLYDLLYDSQTSYEPSAFVIRPGFVFGF